MAEKTNDTSFTMETLLYTDMQLEIDGMCFEVNIYFPKENADSVSDKLLYLVEGKKVS